MSSEDILSSGSEHPFPSNISPPSKKLRIDSSCCITNSNSTANNNKMSNVSDFEIIICHLIVWLAVNVKPGRGYVGLLWWWFQPQVANFSSIFFFIMFFLLHLLLRIASGLPFEPGESPDDAIWCGEGVSTNSSMTDRWLALILIWKPKKYRAHLSFFTIFSCRSTTIQSPFCVGLYVHSDFPE